MDNLPRENKKIIVIAGYLASGKSTFAVWLSKALGVPCFSKDAFKTALTASVPINDRPASSLFSAVTFDAMMYAAERLMEAGYPLIIEGNFVPSGVKKLDEAGVIRALINKYGYGALTYKFTGDTRALYGRFIERDKTPERGQANRMFGGIAQDEFDGYCRNLDAFGVGGEAVAVDTTDFGKVDFDGLIEKGRSFLEIIDAQYYPGAQI